MTPAAARRLAPVVVLYGGRIGVAALGLLVLPWLSRVMPAEQFGLTATILALQSLAVVLDLGLSVTIAREFPVLGGQRDRRNLMLRSERTLLVIYVVVAAVATALAMLGLSPAPVPVVLLICLSLLLIVWQNIVVVGFISRQHYLAATFTQFTGLLLRHGCSLAFVIGFAGTVEVFVVGQVVGAAFVLALSRLVFLRQHRDDDRLPPEHANPTGTTSLAVMIYSIAGACTMQLDKVLLSWLASPSDTGPYYLASTLSLVPITFLASPVSQFVQPKLIAALHARRETDVRRWLRQLTLAILVLAVLPGIMLGLAAPWLVPIWLQGAPGELAVSRYALLLLPGASIGALGLVPAIVLIARRDYRAMAVISAALAVTVLATTALLAARGAIAGVCITYSVYHATAAAALWWRAFRVGSHFTNRIAIRDSIANEGGDQTARIHVPQP